MASGQIQTGKDLRYAARTGAFTSHTAGVAPGYIQANLVILPQDWAEDFARFARANPKPCPILEQGIPGDPITRVLAENADVRTDIPGYRVFRDGVLQEQPQNIRDLWQDDYVFFLIGCSFTFEWALLDAGIPLRHVSMNRNVAMYRTNRMCTASGVFKESPLVVSMRPFSPEDADRAVEISASFPAVHGAPVHRGAPEEIGITDLSTPDWGDPVPLLPGEEPLFWACGVTPHLAAQVSKPPIMITHAPGHMFVGDRKNDEYRTTQ